MEARCPNMFQQGWSRRIGMACTEPQPLWTSLQWTRTLTRPQAFQNSGPCLCWTSTDSHELFPLVASALTSWLGSSLTPNWILDPPGKHAISALESLHILCVKHPFWHLLLPSASREPGFCIIMLTLLLGTKLWIVGSHNSPSRALFWKQLSQKYSASEKYHNVFWKVGLPFHDLPIRALLQL